MNEGAELSLGSCLERFKCLQEFLEGSWVRKFEKQLLKRVRRDRCLRREDVLGDKVKCLDCLV